MRLLRKRFLLKQTKTPEYDCRVRSGRAVSLAAYLLVVAAAGLTFGNGQATALEGEEECGTPLNDWVCHASGRVAIWKPSRSTPLLLDHRDRTLRPFTRVRAGRGAEATVRFRKKASCDLGPSLEPTEIVTRVDSETLFQQKAGYADCESLDGSFNPVAYFCETEECPVFFLSNGHFESAGPGTGGAQASSATRNRVVINACTEGFEVKIFEAGRPPRIERDVALQPTQYRIVIVQRSETTETGYRRSFSIRWKGLAWPGICDEAVSDAA